MSLPAQPPVLPTGESGDDDGDTKSYYDSDYGSDWGSDLDSDCDSEEEVDDPDERQIERKNRLFVTYKDGKTWPRFTSSYHDKELQGRSRFSPRNEYDRKTPTVLRQYVKGRMLTDPYPKGLTLKYFYLRLLDRDDRLRTFRFLDLSPELRNMVYKQLLTFADCPSCSAAHGPCHPAILRTSKQIYSEANTILYADNEVHCRFTSHGAIHGYSPPSFFSSIHQREITGGNGSALDYLFHGMRLIPEYLRKIQRLHVDVEYSGGGLANARFSLQSCLLNLASFLMDDHCLRVLRIHIFDMAKNADDDVAYTTELDGIVYPLRRLRGIKEVELIGVSDALKDAIIADMKSTTSTFNTMKHMYQLQQEAQGYLRMVHAIDPWNGEFWQDAESPPRGYDLSDDIRYISTELGSFGEMDEDYNAFLDAETESNTRRKMEDLKDCLARVNLDGLERRRNEYLELKTTRAEYVSKSKWLAPEGTNMIMSGIRRNWQPRLDEEEYY